MKSNSMIALLQAVSADASVVRISLDFLVQVFFIGNLLFVYESVVGKLSVRLLVEIEPDIEQVHESIQAMP